MKKFLFLLLTISLLTACDKAPQEPARAAAAESQPSAKEMVVAEVGPVQITQAQLENRLALLPEEDQEFAKTNIGRKNFIQLLVREELAALDAKEEELDKQDFYLTALEDKREQLKEIYQDFSKDLLNRMWEEHLLKSGVIAVTDQEIADYFDKYPYEMTIKQIIIADAETADAVLRELKRSKKRWRELERQYSKAPQQSQNQEISFMPGEFIAELEVIAANTPTGSTQGFVKTSQGFHIIMKTGERRLKLKEAAPRIRTILENQKMDSALNALQKKYKVVIYE
ncbi:MAG: peptidylprolyl isomerase [Elusimicrobiaceae bacterium]|nr:peptidylprolyl isomerase [Elusimicrobiaceae bacterium]MBR3898864.1 peptidylprolyl isomerase [Elusimicrobiaceae bacterium]